MATFNTPHYLAQVPTRTNTSRNAEASVSDGEIQFAQIKHTFDGTEANADVVNLCILPAGVIPVPELSNVVLSGDPGTTLVVDVGTAEDADGWADGIVLSAAASTPTWFTTPAQPAWSTTKTKIAADTGSGNAVVKATLASAGTVTASTVAIFTLAYKRNR